MSPKKELEKVIYFAAYLVTHVDEDKRQKELPELEENLHAEISYCAKLTVENPAVSSGSSKSSARWKRAVRKSQEISARRREVEKEIQEAEDRAERGKPASSRKPSTRSALWPPKS